MLRHGGPEEMCGVIFGRFASDFRDLQLELLPAVQPRLRAIEWHARVRERWSRTPGVPVAAGEAAVRNAESSARQVEIPHRLAEGLTAAAMARRLGCRPRTVQKAPREASTAASASGERVIAVLEAQRRNLLCPAGRPPMPLGFLGPFGGLRNCPG